MRDVVENPLFLPRSRAFSPVSRALIGRTMFPTSPSALTVHSLLLRWARCHAMNAPFPGSD
jgi:hypothetical protein